MMMTGNRRVENGFTLIELLVVIAIVGILAGLLIPAVSYGKFKTRVTTCGNNFRQIALAAALYAGDDSNGRLPSFELPTQSSQLAEWSRLYPSIIALPMLKAMEARGIAQPRMWYCPVRDRWQSASATFQWKFGRPMETINDFTRYFTDIQKSKFGFFQDLNWWVPRRLEGSPNVTYPDVSLLTTRLKAPWPSKMDDLTTSTRPIISDGLDGVKDGSGDSFTKASGAHAFAGKIRNANCGYPDGHVETHSANKIKWELDTREGEWSYIFY